MNWSKALNIIEQALTSGKDVSVSYHRKWHKQEEHFDVVEKIISYEWDGETVKAISTYHNVVDPFSHIIDSVEVGD